jgi:hypothetical protein
MGNKEASREKERPSDGECGVVGDVWVEERQGQKVVVDTGSSSSTMRMPAAAPVDRTTTTTKGTTTTTTTIGHHHLNSNLT